MISARSKHAVKRRRTATGGVFEALTVALVVCIASVLGGCAKAPLPVGAEPEVRARVLTPEQAGAVSGEAPTQADAFIDILPPPDWMSTDWLISSPD